MKKFFLVMVFTVAFYNAKAQMTVEKQKVNETIANFFEGFSTRDISIIKKYATVDFLLLEDAVVWNIDTLVNRFIIAKARGGSFTRVNYFDFIKTEIKGNTAWMAYHNTAHIVSGGNQRTVKWLESAVLVKQGKEWKIQMMHSTPVR